jgi:hypothetical protein
MVGQTDHIGFAADFQPRPASVLPTVENGVVKIPRLIGLAIMKDGIPK